MLCKVYTEVGTSKHNNASIKSMCQIARQGYLNYRGNIENLHVLHTFER